MARKVEAAFSKPSLGKRLLFWLVVLAAPLFALELGLRTYFAFELGSSTFFYGTSVNREKGGDAHSGDLHLLDGYFKYHPHQERFTRDRESGRLIRVTINSRSSARFSAYAGSEARLCGSRGSLSTSKSSPTGLVLNHAAWPDASTEVDAPCSPEQERSSGCHT